MTQVAESFRSPHSASPMSISSLQMNTGGGGALYPDPPDYDGEQRYDRLDDSRYRLVESNKSHSHDYVKYVLLYDNIK